MARVAITGAGTVNALGHDVPATLRAMAAAQCGIGPLELRDVERLSVRIGAQVRDWQPEIRFTRRELALYDRFTQFAVVAAAEAIGQSGLDFGGALGAEAGIILGNAGGGIGTGDDSYRALYEEGRNRVDPLVVPRLMNNAAASQISLLHNLQGPALTISTACASANHAMGLAFQMVRSGQARVMVTGGTEAMLSLGGIKAWEGLRVLAPTACRPFSADREGMVLGEGAAIFVFEDWDAARARGAEILAEVAGFSMCADAGDIVRPSAAGAARAMRGALADAGLAAGDIGYINAHGTGTLHNDRTEARAIHDVFGADAARVPVSSTKAMHGHAVGAAGAIELLACVMALRDGIIAPTLGFRTPDPECALDVVPNEARRAVIGATLSNAFAFGGLNAVLALKRA